MNATSDRLWPVLLALLTLLAGATALELVAKNRAGDGRVVHISGAASATVAEDDEGNDGEAGAALESSPPVDEDHARARLAARRGQIDEAMTLYARAAAAHPEAARIHAEMGYFWLGAGTPARARTELEQAAALAPDDPWILLTLGIARARLGDSSGAEKLYRRALELRPHYGAARVALGVALRRRGHAEEAIAMLEPAAESGSNSERARTLVVLGRAYLSAKKRPAAEQAFTRAIEYAPADVEVRLGIGRAWMGTGRGEDLARAAAELARAAEVAPDMPQVFSALARVKQRRGDLAGAEADYERALRIDPDYRYARRRLLRLALDREDYPRARLQAEYLLARAPDVPEHHLLAGLVAARDGRKDEARAHYRDAIARAGGGYPEAYLNLGVVEKNAGDLAAASAAYRKAIELRPDYVQAYNNLGLAQVQAKELADAEATFKRAIAIDKGYATAWLNLGELYAGQQRTDEAIAAFQTAIAARPNYAEARLDLGVALAHAGRTHEAIATYRELVTAQPRYLSGWFNLGIALEGAGDLDGAADAYQHALGIDADHVASLRRLGDLEARRGRAGAATHMFEEVLDRLPNDRGARLALAEQRRLNGDLDGCAHEARAVLSSQPGDDVATRLYSQCSTRH